jgi:hypothetical protein
MNALALIAVFLLTVLAIVAASVLWSIGLDTFDGISFVTGIAACGALFTAFHLFTTNAGARS